MEKNGLPETQDMQAIPVVQDLSEVQLALVGGGIGETIL